MSNIFDNFHDARLRKVGDWLIIGVCCFFLLAGIFSLTQAFNSYQHTEILLTWSTASEVNTAGFNIIRGDTPDLIAMQINAELIPASPSPLAGSSYRFTDTDVRPGGVYFYVIEEVELDGKTNRFDPIQVVARRGGVLLGVGSIVLIVLGMTGFLFRIFSNKNIQVAQVFRKRQI